MTKETARTVNTYRVRVDYRTDGAERTPTVLVLEADGPDDADRLGRRLFDEWAAYHREHGYAGFTGLSVTGVTCVFVDSRTA